MPESPATREAREAREAAEANARKQAAAAIALSRLQARVLAALMPKPEFLDPDDSFYWPAINRFELCLRAGFRMELDKPTSGSITRTMNGINLRQIIGGKPRSGNWTEVSPGVWEGSSSGKPHPGLLERGLVESMVFDIEGVKELDYQITEAGIRAYQAYVAKHGPLPEVKDAATSTNRRYRE